MGHLYRRRIPRHRLRHSPCGNHRARRTGSDLWHRRLPLPRVRRHRGGPDTDTETDTETDTDAETDTDTDTDTDTETDADIRSPPEPIHILPSRGGCTNISRSAIFGSGIGRYPCRGHP